MNTERLDYLETYLRTIHDKSADSNLMIFNSADDSQIRIAIDFIENKLFVLDTETEYNTIDVSNLFFNIFYNKEND